MAQVREENSVSTKNQLLYCLDDIDLIIRQLLETIKQSSSQDSTISSPDSYKMLSSQLTDLLIKRNEKLSKLSITAREQQKVYHHIQVVKDDISNHNKMISCLHKKLKGAEYLLAASLYEAKEALKKFDAAAAAPVLSEDVVRYAHKISASCSTAAPLNWTPGDPRRPYPQDIQMRSGLLGQLSNMPTLTDSEVNLPKQLGIEGVQVPDYSKSDSRWQTSDSSNLTDNLLKADVEEVDIMSSDSSTSDSSDSSFEED